MRNIIIEHLDGWNENKYSADSRDALRHLLHWTPHNGKSLGTLIVEALEQNKPAVKTTNIRQAIIDVVEGRKVYSTACVALLNSRWPRVDPAGMVQKSPEEITSYLTDLSTEVGKFDDLFSSRRNLLKMIFDAYLRWERHHDDN